MSLKSLLDLNVDSGRPNFEKFDIDKNDKVRILIPKLEVASEFVHVFHTEAPEMVTNDRGKSVPRWSRESFGGMFLCLGDHDTVLSNTRFGDPANCPACRRMQDETRLIESPRLTFAMNVLQYNTKPGDNMSLRNNGVNVKLWRHADRKKIETIVDIAKQVEGKIHNVDILITADGTEWKKLTITPSVDGTKYNKDEELKANVVAAIKEELYDEDTLRAACGKPVSEEEMEMEVNRIYQAFNGIVSSPKEETTVAASTPAPAAPAQAEEVAKAAPVAETGESVQLADLSLDDLSSLVGD